MALYIWLYKALNGPVTLYSPILALYIYPLHGHIWPRMALYMSLQGFIYSPTSPYMAKALWP